MATTRKMANVTQPTESSSNIPVPSSAVLSKRKIVAGKNLAQMARATAIQNRADASSNQKRISAKFIKPDGRSPPRRTPSPPESLMIQLATKRSEDSRQQA